MDLVVDANILFAALIKNGITQFLIFRDNLHLFAPEFIFTELEKYTDEIAQKAGKTKEELDEVLNVIMRRITVVPEDEFGGYFKKALEISPDKKDSAYIALALRLKCSIWSNDKALKNQNKVKVYNTPEVNKI